MKNSTRLGQLGARSGTICFWKMYRMRIRNNKSPYYVCSTYDYNYQTDQNFLEIYE